MKFKRDAKAKENFVKVTKSIEKKLLNIDSEIANEFVEWFDKKATYLKQSLQKSSYLPQPDDLKKGDIVWVEFGINVGTELSDYKTKGHYGVVWKVDLGNVIVIPLSSNKSIGSSLTYDLGIIEGLNENDKNHSYLKLDAIRSVSKRRIGRMNNKENGKLTLAEDKIDVIRKAIFNSFVLDNSL